MTFEFSQPFTQHLAERSGHIWIHAEPSQPEWNLTPEAAAWMATASPASHGPVCHLNVKAQSKSFAPQLTNAITFFTAEFAAGLIGVIPFILGSDREIYLLSAVSVRCGCQAWAKPKEVQSNYTNPRCPSLFASELQNRFWRFYRMNSSELICKVCQAQALSCSLSEDLRVAWLSLYLLWISIIMVLFKWR